MLFCEEMVERIVLWQKKRVILAFLSLNQNFTLPLQIVFDLIKIDYGTYTSDIQYAQSS